MALVLEFTATCTSNNLAISGTESNINRRALLHEEFLELHIIGRVLVWLIWS